MKCANCGNELRDGCIYCSNCGKEAQIVPDYNVFEDEFLNSLILETESDNQEDVISEKKVENTKKPSGKRKVKTGAIVAIVLVVMVLIGVIGAVVYVQIRAEQNSSFDYQISKAEEALEANDAEMAISYFERALALENDNLEIRQRLVDIYLDKEDYDSALMLSMEMIGKDSGNIEAYETVISIYDSRQDYDSIFALKEKVKDKQILEMFEPYEVDPPRFSMAGGVYTEYISVALSSAANHKILYTLNGDDPIESGSVYEEEFSLNEMGEYTIKAVCVNEKKLYSNVITLTYKIDIPAPEKPEVTPTGGTFEEETTIEIKVPAGCAAYYTWDGTEPTIASTLYKEPFTIPEGNHVLSVILFDEETGKMSEVYQEIYLYYPQ